MLTRVNSGFLLVVSDITHLNCTGLMIIRQLLNSSKLEQNKPSGAAERAVAFVIVFFSLCEFVFACTSAQEGGGVTFRGAIVTLTPGRLLSDALVTDPISLWEAGP